MQNTKKRKTYTNLSNRKKSSNFFANLSKSNYNVIQRSSVSNSINSLKKRINYLSPPIKTSSYESGFNPASFSPNGTGLQCYPQFGNAPNERLGSDIILKSIEIRYTYAVSALTPDTYNVCRLTIVQFTGNNGDGEYPTVPNNNAGAVDTVFVPGSITLYGSTNLFNSKTKQEYRVLYDRTLTVNPVNSPSVTGHVLLTKFPVSKLHFFTNNSDLNLPGLSEGLIVMFISSDSFVAPLLS